MAKMTLEKLRESLPITREVAYFQTGSRGPTPDPVLQTVADSMAAESRSGPAIPETRKRLAEEERQAREDMAELIGVESSELAITRNTSWAMQQVMRGFEWREGDEFIISSLEHVSTFGICVALREHRGVVTRVIEADQGDAVMLEALKSSLNDRTKLVCLSEIASPDGRKLPIQAAAAIAHEQEVPVVVDAAQSVGQYPVDAKQLGCDFYLGSGHKWLLGPSGTGFLYVTSDQVEGFQPNFIPDFHPWTFPDAPKPAIDAAARLEIGSVNHAVIIGLGHAVKLINEIGVDRIDSHVAQLSKDLREAADGMPRVNVLTPMEPGASAGITTLTFDGFDDVDLQDLVGRLFENHRVQVKFQWLTADPPQHERVGMRISVAAFNTAEEIDRLVNGLRVEIPA